ncbi:MAG: aminotransferase class I/II-fold pyridoxal phosphate-dependent enzyme [Bdellovibrionales bacterium]|nr:aminotransferase class I/II-fold pyridoxal phosphate-dependent enzyme [Bdellovibrionales bacterium]
MSSRSQGFSLSPIKEIELHASKIPGSISLAQGIPYLPTPTEVIHFVEECMRAGLCDRYSLSPGLLELREELSLSLRADGASYDPDSEIIVTAGSIQGMTATLLSIVEKGCEVIVPSPTYASYIGSVRLAEAEPRYVALNEDSGFDLDLDAFRQAVTNRTKAILLCTPNNPTGTVYSPDTLEALLRFAVERNLYVIVDEVYKDFYFGDTPHVSPASFPWARDNIIRVCSFSKAYAMTGWRVGFLAAPKAVADTLLRVHDVMVSCAPVASQYAALGALRYGDEARMRFIAEFRERRDLTVAFLDQMSEWLDYQVPRATYFAFPRIKDTVPLARRSRELVYDILRKQKVAFVEGAAFGPSGESHIRINFGRSEKDIREGMSRLGEYLQAGVSKRVANQTPTTSPNERVPPSSILTSLRNKLLIELTRISRRNCKASTVAVIGLRGKTVVRRLITRELEQSGSVQSSTLSHNTLVGLCYSLLDIPAPTSLVGKFGSLIVALGQAIRGQSGPEVNVLEYGLTNSLEVPQYLHLARPDYIVITSGLGFDKNIDNSSALEAMKEFCRRASPKKVFVPDDEEWLTERMALPSELVRLVPPAKEGTCGRSEQFGLSFAHHVIESIQSVA